MVLKVHLRELWDSGTLFLCALVHDVRSFFPQLYPPATICCLTTIPKEYQTRKSNYKVKYLPSQVACYVYFSTGTES